MSVYYITTAIDYTNAAPHIGHAYEKVLADVIARYRRLCGEEVYFLTGVDQHGTKVKQAAEKQGVEPGKFADAITAKFTVLWDTLGISYDGWARTTDPRHIRAVQAVLTDLHEKGELYKASHRGFYSVRQEQFLTEKERDSEGNFGPEWGEVMEIEEENWYFRLSAHQAWLAAFLQQRQDFIFPEFRRNELLNAVDRLTGDLCISRPKQRLSWGIELPFDSEYVTYVWFDALINYISFAGYKSASDTSLPEFEKLWPADAHVIGKDILVPAHGVYWPVMLHAIGIADSDIPQLLVHGWWNISGAKMSKSLGNVIDPVELAATFGANTLRYYLMRDISTGQDADFSEDRLRQRHNADLANDLGNLLNRSLSMAKRYRNSHLNTTGNPAGDALVTLQLEVIEEYHRFMRGFMVHSALECVWRLISECNSYIESSAPWKLAKDPAFAQQLDQVLYRLAETLRIVALLISPVLPDAAQKMFAQLQWQPAPGRPLIDLLADSLPAGHSLGDPVPLFPRLDS